jgi:alpha,alpha-trehalase
MAQVYYEFLPEIFKRAHYEHVSNDGKAIADAMPLKTLEAIRNAYNDLSLQSDFDFKALFFENFELPKGSTSDFVSNTNDSVEDHIKKLWPILTRDADNVVDGSSLIALPNKYVVPGGRFNEVYYWDSYFTMLGLAIHDKVDLIQSMVDNFAFMIETFGYIPNGNRTYYTGRSQPPFFSHMVCLLADALNDQKIIVKYLAQLKKEFAFFTSHVRSYTFVDGTKLYRYFDENDTPRIEMYGDDVKEAADVDNKPEFYRHMRSACESGWDFSSRWMKDATALNTIHTRDIIPVDLNCLLYHLARTIANASTQQDEQNDFGTKAKNLRDGINTHLWNNEKSMYFDYDIDSSQHTAIISCAAFYPLFVEISTDDQAKSIIENALSVLLQGGGLTSTDKFTNQQWDAPNGWAPLQWIAVKGLKDYGYNNQANEIAHRWIKLNDAVFKRTGKMMEKYNVVDISLDAGGGEYDVQDGFGWTNGVYLALTSILK